MITFEDVPYDIIFELSKYLSLDDVVRLSQTCRYVRNTIFTTDQVAREVVRAHHTYTVEASEATNEPTSWSYRRALCDIYDRRNAFSNARPFAVQIIGQGKEFLYQSGVLCVQHDNIITVTNLRSAACSIQFDVLQVDGDNDGNNYQMLHYSDEILALQRSNTDDPAGHHRDIILAISTRSGLADEDRLIGYVAALERPVANTRLFVRHNSEYLYLGTHDGEGRDGHRKWHITAYSLLNLHITGDSLQQGPSLILEDFHGNDIGSTVVFKIHDGYFYAVSNQGTYEVEEVDWTSFYHCVRLPLGEHTEEAIQRETRVYRRQHAEGAIHDSWTDLTLQPDEETNDLYIVESRREWLGATSKQLRSFYTYRVQFPTSASTDNTQDMGPSVSDTSQPRPLPDNDIFTTLLDSSHNANYMPTPDQYTWTRHPEFPHGNISPRSFILAKTKYRAYNRSCSTFVDIVEDDTCCSDRPADARPCLRLRMGSRRVAPLTCISAIDYGNGKSAQRDDTMVVSPTNFVDDTQYRYSEINMWPPPPTQCPCAARLHRIMNPVFRSNCAWNARGIQAVSDERSIIYMVDFREPYDYMDGKKRVAPIGTIVHIDFGRSSWNGDGLRWERAVGQEKRCKDQKCI